MSDVWDNVSAMVNKYIKSTDIFIRLTNNRNRVVGAFCGDPYARELIWTGEKFEQLNKNNFPTHKISGPIYPSCVLC